MNIIKHIDFSFAAQFHTPRNPLEPGADLHLKIWGYTSALPNGEYGWRLALTFQTGATARSLVLDHTEPLESPEAAEAQLRHYGSGLDACIRLWANIAEGK